MVEEEIRLHVVQGFYVVDKGAVVGLHVPEPAGFPAPPARAGLRNGVVQFARARIGDVSNPPGARVEEVALDPCGEVRAHGPRDGTRNIPQAQPRADVRRPRPLADAFRPRRAEGPLSRPFHAAQSTRCRGTTQ